MSFEMDDDAFDATEEDAGFDEYAVAETEIEDLDIETTSQNGSELASMGDVSSEMNAGQMETGQHEIAHPTSQAADVPPTANQTHDMAVRVIGEVGEFVQGKDFDNPPVVNSVSVRAADDSGVAGSYSDGVIEISNYPNADLNVATAAHEGMHASSFNSDYVEVDPETGNFVQHHIGGIDEVSSVYGPDGTLISEFRDNELLNEGFTENYTNEMLGDYGYSAAAVEMGERSLSYDIAADIAGELRESYGDLADQAYFNGDVGSLRDAFDNASGIPGTFDELSTLLDRVGNENLTLQERIDSYDRAYELLDMAKC